jgi:hypothetical protein
MSVEKVSEIKLYAKGFIGAAAPSAAISLSFEQHIEIWLRLLGLALACAVSASTLCSIWRSRKEKARINDIETQREEARMCQECISGSPPPKCPVPPAERPKGCPRGVSPFPDK